MCRCANSNYRNFQLYRNCILHEPTAQEWVDNPQANGLMGLLRHA